MKTSPLLFMWALCLSCVSQAAVFSTNYDTLGRSTEIVRSQTISTKYAYDAAGNRTRKTTKYAAATVPAVIAKGQFLGTIDVPSGGLIPAQVSVNVATTGTFTASLLLNGRKVSWTGKLVASIGGVTTWIGSVTDLVLGPLAMRLELPADGSQMTFTLTRDSVTNTSLLALIGQVGSGEVAAGNYTVILAGNPDFPDDAYPQGDGYATLRVATNGIVTLTGKLGDSTPVTQSTALTSDGRFQVFVPLYKNGGVLTGWIDFIPINEVSDFNGTLQWSKPVAPTPAFYTTGFDFEIDLLGSKFTPPLSGLRILSLANSANNGALLIDRGNLPGQVTETLTLDTANKVLFTAPGIASPVFTITPSTGLFVGSFFHSQLAKRVNFSGIVFQKQRLATGYFLGQDQSGYVTLHASATGQLLLPAATSGTPLNENDNPPVIGPRYSLSASATNGTVAKNPNLTSYASGAMVQLTANPSSGYAFDHWSGAASGSQNPLTVTMSGDMTVTAVFSTVPTPHAISATASPANGGTISGTGNFANGGPVSLVATPATGYEFVNWLEGATEVGTSATLAFTASASRSLIAQFQLLPVLVTRFSDDFNNNAIDPAKWTVVGNTATEANQQMELRQAITDNGPTVTTTAFPVNAAGKIIIRRRAFVHYAGSNTRMRLNIVIGTLPRFCISYANDNYGIYRYGFFVVRNNTNESTSTDNVAEAVTPIWDTWFNERLEYNPTTGDLDYFINEVLKRSYNVGSLPASASPTMEVSFHSWGWFTGQQHFFDDLEVSQE